MSFGRALINLFGAAVVAAGLAACGGTDPSEIDTTEDALKFKYTASACYGDPRGHEWCPHPEIWCCYDPQQPRTCGCKHIDDVVLVID